MIRPEEIIERVHALPALPGTALRLIEVINDPKSSVDDIVETIRYDQAITAEVLRLCNSAFFGMSRKITSLHEAMVYLGGVKLLQMVMAAHTSTFLSRGQAGYGLDPGVLWKHSMAVALGCSGFAERLKHPQASLMFTAGLLHDIGKVVLNEYVAEEFALIIRRVTEDGLSFTEAEQEVLGFSHEQVGGMLAEAWLLPDPIIRCIRHHRNPSALEPPDMSVDIVYLADALSLMMGLGLGRDGLYYRADPEVMRRHGLTQTDLEMIGVRVVTETKRVEQMFDQSGRNSDDNGQGGRHNGAARHDE